MVECDLSSWNSKDFRCSIKNKETEKSAVVAYEWKEKYAMDRSRTALTRISNQHQSIIWLTKKTRSLKALPIYSSKLFIVLQTDSYNPSIFGSRN